MYHVPEQYVILLLLLLLVLLLPPWTSLKKKENVGFMSGNREDRSIIMRYCSSI